MSNYFIGEPTEFRQMEGKSIDFRKTFDLNGKDNDEMLRLYLRKAGMSDNIEDLSQEQRRNYIYDIIRSNKPAGYWMPPTTKHTTPPSVRPPPVSPNMSPYSARNNNGTVGSSYSPQPSTGSMSSSSSTSSLQSFANTQRFVAAPDTPPSPTAIMATAKGSKYEISGPMNFQHLSGDMTRDRTRNAFDLSASSNDNLLKKYMMERGICEADISGMRKQELIKKIVHSNFTWMPPKRNEEPKLFYATISTNNEKILPPSPPKTSVSQPAPKMDNTKFSNYATITSRFLDLSDLSMDDLLVESAPAANTSHITSSSQLQQEIPKKAPPPPPRKHNSNLDAMFSPPPPSHVVATANNGIAQQQSDTVDKKQIHELRHPDEPMYAQIKPKTKPHMPAPKPVLPPPPIQRKPIQQQPTSVQPLPTTPSAIPPPPPPPPPPPAPAPAPALSSEAPLAAGAPPPPPMPQLMPSIKVDKTVANGQTKTNPIENDDQDRDALLASIRNGIVLKKVDRKSATISGIKPRAERRPPPVNDFLSELKMGITLRRVKNPANNPYLENCNDDESHA